MALIEFSIFSDFHRSGNGGVILFDDINFALHCCSFLRNTVTISGGCIYCSNSALNISTSTFSHCYSTSHKDSDSGNAIHQSQNTFYLYESSVFQCGDSQSESSDSCIKTERSMAVVSIYNASGNCGYWGASGISIPESLANSFVKYMNVYDICDYHAIEASSNQYCVNWSNFVKFDGDYCQAISWVNANNIISFFECCFFETANLAMTTGSYSLELISCLSDKMLPSISTTTKLTTFSITFNEKCITALQKTCF